jgi:D-glutamate cyclase
MKLAGKPTRAVRTPQGVAPAMTDYIDQLVTVEMRNRALPNHKVGPLYDAARAEGGGGPLGYREAQGLVNAVRPGDTFFTSAGSGLLIPKGENDGPVGGAVLARALQRGLGATPIMVCEWQHVDPILSACEAIGVAIRDAGVAIRSMVQMLNEMVRIYLERPATGVIH